MSKDKNSTNKLDWLPNWQDLTQYPDSKKGIGRIWAWEFLRRNPKYQQLWQEYAALPKSAGFIYHGFSVFEIRDRFENEFGVSYPAAPPSMTASDPEFERRVRFTTQQPPYWTLPLDPSEECDFGALDIEHPAEVIVKFDLRLQLSPQLARTKAILKIEAKRLAKAGVLGGEPRSRFEQYQDYLRVLDAKTSGASSKMIAKEILGVTDKAALDDTQYLKEKVDDVFEPAKRLRDGGYRFLTAVRGK